MSDASPRQSGSIERRYRFLYKPLLFLVHHHLVPTPITDVGEIDIEGRPALVGLLVKYLLPSVVANADREELTMTALGAARNRPVLVQRQNR